MLSGTLVLLGGGDVGDPVLAAEILRRSPGPTVAVLPTARAFEGPEAALIEIASWLGPHGAEVEGVMALTRADAEVAELAARLDGADLAYVSDGTALHLRSVLKSTVLFERLMAVLERGGTVVASGAAASVLCDPMVDPRGGAPTVGLGPNTSFLVVPHLGADADDPHGEKLARTVALARSSHLVVALGLGTGLVLQAGRPVEVIGAGELVVYRAGEVVPEGIGALR